MRIPTSFSTLSTSKSIPGDSFPFVVNYGGIPLTLCKYYYLDIQELPVVVGISAAHTSVGLRDDGSKFNNTIRPFKFKGRNIVPINSHVAAYYPITHINEYSAEHQKNDLFIVLFDETDFYLDDILSFPTLSLNIYPSPSSLNLFHISDHSVKFINTRKSLGELNDDVITISEPTFVGSSGGPWHCSTDNTIVGITVTGDNSNRDALSSSRIIRELDRVIDRSDSSPVVINFSNFNDWEVSTPQPNNITSPGHDITLEPSSAIFRPLKVSDSILFSSIETPIDLPKANDIHLDENPPFLQAHFISLEDFSPEDTVRMRITYFDTNSQTFETLQSTITPKSKYPNGFNLELYIRLPYKSETTTLHVDVIGSPRLELEYVVLEF